MKLQIEEIVQYCESRGHTYEQKLKFVESRFNQHNKDDAQGNDRESVNQIHQDRTDDIKTTQCRACGNKELEKRRFIKSDTLADNYIETIIFCADCGEVYKTIILEQ